MVAHGGGVFGRGFSLIEMCIVLALLAALLTVASPAYQRQAVQARRAVAVAELYSLSARLDSFFQDHFRYTGSFTDLGLPESPYAIDPKGQPVAVSDASRIYRMELQQQGNGYVLLARPEGVHARDTECGIYSLTDYGLRAVSGPGGLRRCW